MAPPSAALPALLTDPGSWHVNPGSVVSPQGMDDNRLIEPKEAFGAPTEVRPWTRLTSLLVTRHHQGKSPHKIKMIEVLRQRTEETAFPLCFRQDQRVRWALAWPILIPLQRSSLRTGWPFARSEPQPGTSRRRGRVPFDADPGGSATKRVGPNTFRSRVRGPAVGRRRP